MTLFVSLLSQKYSPDQTSHLTTNDIFSSVVATQLGGVTGTGGQWVLRKSFNFDLSEFNLTKIIDGTATIEGTFGVKARATNDTHSYIIFHVIHYDGANETIIGTASTETIDGESSGAWRVKSFTLPLTLTRTHFKKGDVLRVKAELYGMMDTGAPDDADLMLAHDPQNRDYVSGVTLINASASHTSLNVYIPFDLDL